MATQMAGAQRSSLEFEERHFEETHFPRHSCDEAQCHSVQNPSPVALDCFVVAPHRPTRPSTRSSESSSL